MMDKGCFSYNPSRVHLEDLSGVHSHKSQAHLHTFRLHLHPSQARQGPSGVQQDSSGVRHGLPVALHDSSWLHPDLASLEKIKGRNPSEDELNPCQELEATRDKTLNPRKSRKFEETSVFVAALKDCAKRKDLHKGRRIHGDLLKKGILQEDIYLGSALVNMYAKCGMMTKAREVFDELPARDRVTWNVLIGGYSQHGQGDEALICLERMRGEGLSPDTFTYVCILKACGNIEKVHEVHGEIIELIKEGLLDDNVIVNTALVDMYAKFGELSKAREVFDKIVVRNVVSWTALIGGYAQCGYGEEALHCFALMQAEGLSPDVFTFVSTLKAIGIVGAGKEGQEIHARIVRDHSLGKSIVVDTALVDMYAKCGLLSKAQEVFNEIPVRNVVSWTTLISGYTQHGHNEEALSCYESMRRQSIAPNEAILLCVLKACASIGAIDKGREIHAQIVQEGSLEQNDIIGTALVDMYAKCGDITKAQQVFDRLSVQNIVSWTALIAGYAHLGGHDMVCNTFDKMIAKGITPNLITFTVVLNACNHLGLLEKGQMYFEAMGNTYGIISTVEHLTCMVDLFGRAGNFDKAVEIVKKMESACCDHRPLWISLLGSCQKWRNMEVGRWAFEHVVRLDETRASGTYACMSNIYAASSIKQ